MERWPGPARRAGLAWGMARRMVWPSRMVWRSPRTTPPLAFGMGRRLVWGMVPALLGRRRLGQPQLGLRLRTLLRALPRAGRMRPVVWPDGIRSSEIERADQAAGMGDPAASSSLDSSSVKRRLRVRNRSPSGASSEKPAPRPGTTSMISCVCFQYSNWAAPM